MADESTTYLDDEEIDSENSLASEYESSADAIAEDACPECGKPGLGKKEEWCTRCGFYPRLGIKIEVDPDPEEAPPKPETAIDILKQTPAWMPVMLGGLVALLGMSIAVRLLIPVDNIARPLWAIGQCLIGFMVFMVMHIISYLYAIVEDSAYSVGDIILRPLKVWGPTINSLPKTSRRVCLGVWGFAGSIMALTVVGGIPYHLVWEMGPEQQAKMNLVQAISEQAQQVEGDADNLEDAIEDFTGKAGDLEEEEIEEVDPYEAPARARHIDCLVLGFEPDGEGSFSSLALAAVRKGKLQFVGAVTNQYINPETRQLMMDEMVLHEVPKPFVKVSSSRFTWLAPKLTCKIGYNAWSTSGKLKDAVFDKRLSDLEDR